MTAHIRLKPLLVAMFWGLVAQLQAQSIITMNPPFATANDNNVVITYDASQGNAGLLGQSTIMPIRA